MFQPVHNLLHSCATSHNGELKDEFLYIINLPSGTRREDIYQTINTLFKANGNKWELLNGL